MGKLLKIIIGLGVAVVGLVVVLVIVLPLIIDPNDYKDEIAAAVETYTGRTLTIEGDIGLSVFPWLGLDIGATQLSNAAGFGDRPMVTVETVQVRVKLLPLLRKQLEMDTARLAGLTLYLARNAAGKSNWDDLQGEDSAASEEANDQQPKGDNTPLAGLAIGGVEVTGAQVIWEDQSVPVRYEINELSLTTGAVTPGEPIDLKLNFQLAATEPAIQGRFDLRGIIGLSASLQQIRFDDARLALDLQGDTLPGGQLALVMTTGITVDLEQQTLEMPATELEMLGLNLSGGVSGTGISGDDPQFSGTFTIAEFMPREVIKALGQEPPLTADPAVLRTADAWLGWEASSRHVTAKAIKLRLDDTRVNGNAGITNFDDPAITFTLQVDQFDADRYLPPVTEDSEPMAATPATAAAGGAGALPVDTLRALQLDGTLIVGSLKAFNLSSSDIEIRIKSQDGLLRVHPAGASMYGGQYQGDISLDVREDTPRLSMNEQLTRIQAGPLLKDLTGDDKLLGTADMQAQLTAEGATPEAMRRTLNGDAAFTFTDGAIKGVNIAALIRNAQAKLQGQPAPETDLPNQTDFAEIKGTATVTDGLVKNKDLLMQSPLLRITGKGKASLPDETIDYLLTTKIVGSLEGQGGKALGDLKGVAIPVRIGGTFSKPTWTPDLAAALGDAAKEQAREKIEEKTRDLLQDKLGDEGADQLLKGLFK
ncbi:MAG: AsmA family protein [Thiohalobacterales bacterium]